MARESSDAILVFDRLTNDYLDGSITLEEAYAEIADFIGSIFDVYKDQETSPSLRAMSVIALNSCYYYYNRFLSDLLAADPMLALDTFFEANNEVLDMYDEIEGIIKAEIRGAEEAIQEIIAVWENALQRLMVVKKPAA